MNFFRSKIFIFVCIALALGFGIRQFTKKPTLTIKLTNHGGVKKPRGIIKNILKERYEIKISDKNYDMIFDGPYGPNDRDYSVLEERDPKILKMFYTPEAVLPNLNNYDLTIAFDHLDDPRYTRFGWYYMYPFRSKITTNYNKVADLGKCNPKKPYFGCFLVSNNMEGLNPRNNMPLDGCAARVSLFNNLSKYKRIESGGNALNNIGRVIPGKETGEWLSKCKFVIAYENQSYDGYITEKPFQAYFSGAIPIYYGAENAVADINKKAVIYAGDYKTEEDLIEYIKKVDNDDDLYCKIWNENIIDDPERNFEVAYAKLRDKIFEVIDAKLKK